ncbi:hypothetical protein ACFPN7_24110 [Amycolatopsis halotolerans]|uniref:hypothetical protein n=1 Tax=Amycolatopsis halotolerans TaxID=330083 RepID=UPI00361E4047
MPDPSRRSRNGAARALFEEARSAGLVQRHLRKLHHLARHPHPLTASTPQPVAASAEAAHSATAPTHQPPRGRRRAQQLALGIDLACPPTTPPHRPSTEAAASGEAA